MSPLLQEVLKHFEQLSSEDQRELIRQVTEGLQSQSSSLKPKQKWSDLKGMAPYPMMGEDAQDWISRTRQEGDDQREKALQGT